MAQTRTPPTVPAAANSARTRAGTMGSTASAAPRTELHTPGVLVSDEAPLFCRGLAAAVAICAATVLVGWQLGIRGLQGFVPGFPRMNPITAICFLAMTAALWCMLSEDSPPALRRAGQALAIFGGMLSAVRLSGMLAGRNPDIDQIFYAASVSDLHSPARMAAGTAINFILFAGSLLLLDAEGRPARRVSEFLAFAAGSVSIVAATGYAYGTQPFNGYVLYHSMSFPTSVCFVILVVALLAARPNRGWVAVCLGSGTGALVARRLAPLAIATPIALGWLRILGQRMGWVDVEGGIALMTAAHVILLTAIVLWTVQMLQDLDDERELARVGLQQSEERFRRRSFELEASNKELEAFAYSVSHDLRSPLRGIDGFSRILLDEFGEQIGETGKRYTTQICASAQHMGEVIDDLLNLSRVTRDPLNRQMIDLTFLAEEIAGQLRAGEPGRLVRFEIGRELRAQGDSRLVRLALENLLGNAWKFTRKRANAVIEFGAAPSNGKNGSVNGAAAAFAGVATFFVRDNGAGFDPSHASQLFGVFRRLHGSSEFPGTGIGLATVQRIVQRHGGKVWGEGAIEKGATFSFTLPG
ncbi:MAG TPA: ATP-binding protein [Candidatus Acidoferrales bacterium]